MKKIIRILAAGVVMASLVACGEKKFNVKGEVAGATDSVLYFENVGLSGITVLDSVKLSEDGTFSFSGEAPDAPEFYRLRIYDQIVNVAIDSTETVT